MSQASSGGGRGGCCSSGAADGVVRCCSQNAGAVRERWPGRTGLSAPPPHVRVVGALRNGAVHRRSTRFAWTTMGVLFGPFYINMVM